MTNFLINHSPALIFLMPILASLIILLVGTKLFAIYAFRATNLLSLMMVVFIILKTSKDPAPIYYIFGNWDRAIGIEFKMDKFSLIVLALQYTIALFTINQEFFISSGRKHLPYVLLLFVEAGYSGIILTNDIFNLYVFLEISALATYPLLAIGGSKRAYIEAFNYLVIGTIATTLILVSIGFILALCGSLNLEIIKQYFNQKKQILEVISLMFLMGVCIKLAVFPLHLWKVRSYGECSSFISVFFVSISTIAMVSVLFKFRFLTSSLLLDLKYYINLWGYLTVFFGAFLALRQSKYLSAMIYLSISSVGYYLILWPFATQESVHIFLELLVADSFLKTGLFLVPSLLSRDNFDIISLIGIARKETIASFIVAILLLNAAAMPPTLMFFNKIAFISHISQDGFIYTFLVLISSFASMLVYLRIIRNMLKVSDIEEVLVISTKHLILIIFIILIQLSLIGSNIISLAAKEISLLSFIETQSKMAFTNEEAGQSVIASIPSRRLDLLGNQAQHLVSLRALNSFTASRNLNLDCFVPRNNDQAFSFIREGHKNSTSLEGVY